MARNEIDHRGGEKNEEKTKREKQEGGFGEKSWVTMGVSTSGYTSAAG